MYNYVSDSDVITFGAR